MQQSRRGRTRSEEARAAILRATRDELMANGYDKLSIDRVAAAAGTGKQTVYRAAMDEIGNADRQEIGRWANNRAENSHQPFRRRERAMLRYRRMKTLQKFSSVHAAFHNHFNQDRHLISRHDYKVRRSAAQAEWRSLVA